MLGKIQAGLTFLFTVAIGLTAAVPAAHAQRGGGGHSFGFGIALSTANQSDVNAVNESVNEKEVGSGMEFFGQYSYRFSGSMFALVLRPSYFTQGTAKTKLTGITFFPMLRLVPLENNFIKFFMQTGVGYGNLSAKMEQDAGSVSFKGDAFGAMAGLGADFCFTPNHCMTVEGNMRYLPIQRNVADSVSGTPGGFSQVASGQEVEYNGSDLGTTLSGIQGILAYTLRF